MFNFLYIPCETHIGAESVLSAQGLFIISSAASFFLSLVGVK